MANTTFNGPVRSENGFQTVTKDATTGAVTVGTTVGSDVTVGGDLTAAGSANVIVIPTSDPGVAGAIWNDAGTLSVSAG
jgi:hypothetical protein